jgi:cell division protein FtsB
MSYYQVKMGRKMKHYTENVLKEKKMKQRTIKLLFDEMEQEKQLEELTNENKDLRKQLKKKNMINLLIKENKCLKKLLDG